MRTSIFGQLQNYAKFRCNCKPKHGYRIHSPFAFRAYTKIVEPDKKETEFKRIEEYRKELKHSGLTIIRKAINGTISNNLHGEEISLRKIASNVSVPAFLGRLLYRFSHNLEFDNVIELGTSVGISTLYLAAGNSSRMVFTIDAEESVQNIAKSRFWQLGYKNITTISGDFDTELPKLLETLPNVGLVFIDGNHNSVALQNYVNLIIPKVNESSVIIIDDIRWSSDMEMAWDNIRLNPKVSLSFDLFRCGVLFFRKGLTKQNFKLRFGCY